MARETYGDGTADKRKREEARRLVLVRALKIASLVTSAPYQYTRPRLATDFEVSERTIDRDLAFLRGLGWEIERDREAMAFEPQAGGHVLARLTAGVTPEFIRWILWYGPHCRVLAPASLQEQVRALAESIIAAYSGNKKG